MSDARLIDSCVLIRFLRNDHPTRSPKARGLLERASRGEFTLLLTSVTLAEVFCVLTKVYKVPRTLTLELLEGLIRSEGIEAEEPVRMLDTLHRLQRTKVDFGDAYLAAAAAQSSAPLLTFDSDFNAFRDLKLPGL